MLTTYNDGIEAMRIDSNGAVGIGVSQPIVLDDDPVLQHLRYSEDVALDRILRGECAHLGEWYRYSDLFSYSQFRKRLYKCAQCGMHKMLAEELELE